MFGRERRPWLGLTSFAFNRRHERCFLATDECSCTNPDIYIKVKTRFENPGSQKAMLLGLPDRDLQTTNSQRVFGADIDEALVRPNRSTRNCHPLQHCVWITFKNAAVHKCTRIALVPVADDVFAFARRLRHGCQLQPRGITGSATSAQAALRDRLDD